MAAHKTTGIHNEHYTPGYIIEAAREVLGGISLDPASCAAAQGIVQADYYFTAEDDGLTIHWGPSGLDLDYRPDPWTVWLNPPYGRRDKWIDPKTGAVKEKGPYNSKEWTKKLIAEYDKGNIDAAILLVNAANGSAWFRPLLDRFPICYPRRIKFIDGRTMEPQKQPMYANALVYMGPYPGRFAAVFDHDIGPVQWRMTTARKYWEGGYVGGYLWKI